MSHGGARLLAHFRPAAESSGRRATEVLDWSRICIPKLSMFLYDRARGRARWGRVVPLVALSILMGLSFALGLASLHYIPRWAVTPLGNAIGLVMVWMWLPNAFRPVRRVSYRTRFLAGVASAIVFVWAMIAASWQNPFWLR